MPFASLEAILVISSISLHILGEVKTQQLAGFDPESVIDRDPEVVEFPFFLFLFSLFSWSKTVTGIGGVVKGEPGLVSRSNISTRDKPCHCIGDGRKAAWFFTVEFWITNTPKNHFPNVAVPAKFVYTAL